MAKISADEYFLCLGYFYFSGLGFPKELSNSLVSLSWAYIINTHGVKMANYKISYLLMANVAKISAGEYFLGRLQKIKSVYYF